ncbi:MAG TPA: response regulator [Polyangia bacterium]|nr:response regulator [Polyangia bacterium]
MGATCTKKVLLIEDDEDIRNAMRQVLELEGYVVVPAGNGREGLVALAQHGEPCVILLDLMMPVMNGWEFLAERAHQPQGANVPVVIVSAAGERARKTPAVAHLGKPVNLTRLLDLVEQYCQ